jgi:hypothetical protein
MNKQIPSRQSVDPLANDTQPELEQRRPNAPRGRRPEPNVPVRRDQDGASIGRSADSTAGGAAGELTPKD